MNSRVLGVAAACLIVSSCGGAPSPSATEGAVEVPSAGPPVVAAPGAAGESRFAVAAVLPRDTQVLVEVSDVAQAFRLMTDFTSVAGDRELAPLVTPEGWTKSFATSFQLSQQDARNLVHGLSSAGVAMRQVPERPQFAVVLRFRDGSAVLPLLESSRFKRIDADHFSLKRDGQAERTDDDLTQLLDGLKASGRGEESILWLEGSATLAVGMEPFLADMKDIQAGQRASLVEGTAFSRVVADVPPNAVMRAYWDASMLSRPGIVGDNIATGWFRSPTPWTAALQLDDAGTHFTFTGGFSGQNVPGPGVVPPPTPGKLASLLPEDTWAAMSVSTRSPGGADAVISWFQQMGKLDPEVRALTEMVFGAGPEASQAISALGSEAVLGLVTLEGTVPQFDDDLMDTSAIAWVQDLQAPDTARQLMHRFLDTVAPRRGLKRSPDGFEGSPKPGVEVFVEVKGNRLFAVAGAPAAVTRAREAYRGKAAALTDNASFKRASEVLPAPAQLRAWVDMRRVLQALDAAQGASGGSVVPSSLKTAASSSSSSALSISLATEPNRLDCRVETMNLLGYAAGIGVYGARRYIASSKTSEAKNTIGAIARGAAAAYEREAATGGTVATHKLCKGAPDVPKVVPRGEKYQPVTRDGSDFETGDAEGGWRCLKFTLTQPHYYQYAYRIGGNYKGPKRGGPDPGPHGFEASAEGDVDGDGKTSLFTRTGTVDPKTQRLVFATQIFIADEFE